MKVRSNADIRGEKFRNKFMNFIGKKVMIINLISSN